MTLRKRLKVVVLNYSRISKHSDLTKGNVDIYLSNWSTMFNKAIYRVLSIAIIASEVMV